MHQRGDPQEPEQRLVHAQDTLLHAQHHQDRDQPNISQNVAQIECAALQYVLLILLRSYMIERFNSFGDSYFHNIANTLQKLHGFFMSLQGSMGGARQDRPSGF